MKNQIETARCFLDVPYETDRRGLLALYQDSAVRQFLGGATDETACLAACEKLLSDSDDWNWAVRLKENSEFIGLIQIGAHHDGEAQEISYQFLPSYWGCGLALETVGAAIDFALSALNLPIILAETQMKNILSKTMLERLGMTPFKTLSRFDEEQIIYRKTRNDLAPS